MNNKEIKIQAKMWRKQRKDGVIQMLEYNNKTYDVDGKKYYSIVVQPAFPTDAEIDPLGLLTLGVMVSGFVYVFKNKINRDIIFEYVNKV